MFEGLAKVGALLVGAILLGFPVAAGDFHGQGGNVFHRGMGGPFQHGMHGAGYGSRVADGRNFDVRSRFAHPPTGRSRFEDRRFNDRGMSAQDDMRRYTHGHAFGHGGENGRFPANHLRMLASGDVLMRRGGGISVINRSQPDYDAISNYAGSVDVYHADGGTYISGYGYGDGDGQAENGPAMRPRAKIIDVARMHNSCAYENGVCVIRP